MKAVRLGLWPAGLALGLFAEWASLQRAPFEQASGAAERLAGADVAVGLAFITCGLLLWWRRPESWIGILFTATGFAWFLGTFSVSGQHGYADFGSAFVTLHRGPLVHSLLSYPTGRLTRWSERTIVLIAYVSAVVGGLGTNAEATILIAVLILLAALERYALSSGPSRRARLPATVGAAALAAVLLVGSVSIIFGAGIDQGVQWAYDVVLFGIAIGLTLDLLLRRWTQATVAGLVVDLGQLGEAGTLRDRLAAALGDDSLILGYWLPERGEFADDRGRSVVFPEKGSDRKVTIVQDAGEPVAVLVHDASVLADRELVDSVAAAARIAVSNVRLQAQIRRQMEELAASRRRIVETGDAQRRRLERELHEGAEKRLDHVRALLDQEDGNADADFTALLTETTAELDRAQTELKEFARGIHPRTLSEDGLAAALQDLARRAPVPVELRIAGDRFPVPVEVAAYFVCSEALANTAKYSEATAAAIEVTTHDGMLTLSVSDDGKGGARTDKGSGLRGLADRVEALGGRFAVESPPGRGTRLSAELPLP
jgi:signal transduction histidine kinase